MRLLLAAALLLAIALAIYSESLVDRSGASGTESIYAGDWRTEPHLEISKALAANGVGGCGQMKYKPHREADHEFLVYCTRDGEVWRAYQVWTLIEEAEGPYTPESTEKWQ